eukprot:TRINITY_DN24575_c0_g1_i1.p1 TRINITY_DN24575_c0_g1~~TRINITY_DN24575_c0_g1_i1.p1  ORF type:complete len:650 (+),score=176.62 TRINITY_DN24575_c0_g1_i1:236-2185(+)
MGSAASAKYKKSSAIEEAEEASTAEATEHDDYDEEDDNVDSEGRPLSPTSAGSRVSREMTEWLPGHPPPPGSGGEAHCRVRLVCALDIDAKDSDKLPKPYCCCMVAGQPRNCVRTTPEPDPTLEPHWDEVFDMIIKAEDSLKFFLMDGRQRLGVSTLNNKDFYPKGFEGQMDLENDDGTPNGATLLVAVEVRFIKDPFYFKFKHAAFLQPPMAELKKQKIWRRGDRFSKMTAEWLAGDEWLDEEDVPGGEFEDEDDEEDEEDEEEEEDADAPIDETQSEKEERLKEEEEERLKKLEEEYKEWKRVDELRNDPNHQGWKSWIQQRDWKHEFRTKERMQYLKRHHEKLFPPPEPEPPKRTGRWNWWYVPSIEPDEEGKRWAYRSDFIIDLLAMADAHTPEPMKHIKLEAARKIFKREPQIAYSLAQHREVLGLDGQRELWSHSLIQSIEVLYKRRGVTKVYQDEMEGFKVKLPVDQVEHSNGRPFPKPTEVYKLFVEPVRKPPPKVMRSAKHIRDFLEDLKISHGINADKPTPPDVPTFLPYRKGYVDGPEAWNFLQPPGTRDPVDLFPPEGMPAKFEPVLERMRQRSKMRRQSSGSDTSSRPGSSAALGASGRMVVGTANSSPRSSETGSQAGGGGRKNPKFMATPARPF